MTLEQARTLLSANQQDHVLAFWDTLDGAARAALLDQIASLDFDSIAAMRALLKGRSSAGAQDPGGMEPADVAELSAGDAVRCAQLGEQAIRAGKVGVILVAGGQGSRLGYEGPKGCYPIGPVTRSSLFHYHARKVLALERRYGAEVPLYVMTSPMNNGQTRAFFEAHEYFGLSRDRVLFFSQAMWPALDAEGRILLDAPGHIFMSPDGHGGMLAALERNGCLADMRRRGLSTVFYFQVDNPMVQVADPAFIGYHLWRKADLSIKVCAKRDPDEGLGVVVNRGGRTLMVEYTEFTPEQKRETRADGRLKYLYGSVAIHVFSVDFLVREADAGLPLHIAHKKIPVCAADGSVVKPSAPNGFKFEKFIFDCMSDANVCTCLAFDRSEEFSPVKNAEGNDSPATCRRDLQLKWNRWMAECGCAVATGPDGLPVRPLEIDPCYAMDAATLRERLAQHGRGEDEIILAAR